MKLWKCDECGDSCLKFSMGTPKICGDGSPCDEWYEIEEPEWKCVEEEKKPLSGFAAFREECPEYVKNIEGKGYRQRSMSVKLCKLVYREL